MKGPVAAQKIITDEVSNPRGVLNLDHEIWCNPWNRRLASKASFPDLFRQSLLKCCNGRQKLVPWTQVA